MLGQILVQIGRVYSRGDKGDIDAKRFGPGDDIDKMTLLSIKDQFDLGSYSNRRHTFHNLHFKFQERLFDFPLQIQINKINTNQLPIILFLEPIRPIFSDGEIQLLYIN